MDGDGCNVYGDRRGFITGSLEGLQDDREEGQQREWGVSLSRRAIGDHGVMKDNGLHEEEAGNNSGICSR